MPISRLIECNLTDAMVVKKKSIGENTGEGYLALKGSR